jgi:hypothetical protein
MSRSHLRAVKVDCMPVIVPDTLPYYLPMLKTSGISVEDYSTVISEKEILLDPVATVLFLTQLEQTYLGTKLDYLALAQQLFLLLFKRWTMSWMIIINGMSRTGHGQRPSIMRKHHNLDNFLSYLTMERN